MEPKVHIVLASYNGEKVFEAAGRNVGSPDL